MNLCKCGCGEETKLESIFIHGHNSKGTNNPMYGKIHSGETRRKLSQSYKGQLGYWEGKHHSEETRQKMSASAKGNISHKGKYHSEETKQKISRANTGVHLSKEAKKKMSLARQREKHWNWQGGISFLPYPTTFNKELKQSIKDRDGNECKNPYCEQRSKIRDIHHINYNKQDCSQFNLITLCKSCNYKANFNRKEWKRFYKKIIWGKGTTKITNQEMDNILSNFVGKMKSNYITWLLLKLHKTPNFKERIKLVINMACLI
jgi:hypothetical protein